jgi:hypothetical protein
VKLQQLTLQPTEWCHTFATTSWTDCVRQALAEHLLLAFWGQHTPCALPQAIAVQHPRLLASRALQIAGLTKLGVSDLQDARESCSQLVLLACLCTAVVISAHLSCYLPKLMHVTHSPETYAGIENTELLRVLVALLQRCCWVEAGVRHQRSNAAVTSGLHPLP